MSIHFFKAQILFNFFVIPRWRNGADMSILDRFSRYRVVP